MNRYDIKKTIWFLISLGLVILSGCQKPQDLVLSDRLKGTADELLLSAIKSNDVEQVGVLVNSGKIKNINEVNGQSLLKKVFDNFEFNIAKILLENGADANIQVVHDGKQMPIVQYLFLNSNSDTSGFYAVMIDLLLQYHVDLTQTILAQDFFMEILENRVIPLAQKGDLLFTTWLTLLQTIFEDQCFDSEKYSVAHLEVCKNYIQRLYLFLDQAERNQVVELNIGNIRPFMKAFDLCPQNDALLFPDARGC